MDGPLTGLPHGSRDYNPMGSRVTIFSHPVMSFVLCDQSNFSAITTYGSIFILVHVNYEVILNQHPQINFGFMLSSGPLYKVSEYCCNVI